MNSRNFMIDKLLAKESENEPILNEDDESQNSSTVQNNESSQINEQIDDDEPNHDENADEITISQNLLTNQEGESQQMEQIGYGKKKTKARFYRDNTHQNPIRRQLIGNDPLLSKELDATKFNGNYHVCLDARQMKTGQYKGYRFLGTFELNEMYKAPYPEEELKALFQIVLDHIHNSARQQHLSPDHYIFSLDSPLLDYEIFVNLHNLNETTTEDILNQFERFDQSNRAKGRESVIVGPFQIDAIAIELSEKNQSRKRKHPGAGNEGQQPLKPLPIQFKMNKNAMYLSKKTDHYCLFRAITTALAKETLAPNRFGDFRNDEAKQLRMVNDLMNDCNINPKHLFYDIDDYGEQIQGWLDEKYPGTYKIFAFENTGKLRKPFYKSNVDNYEKPLCIFYWHLEQHYEAIKSINLLFDENSRYKYCFQCEVPYKDEVKHRSWCKSKCKNCQRVGPTYPCKNEKIQNGKDDFKHFCAGCSKLFTNFNCYWYHFTKDICLKSKRCWECNVIYRNDHHKKTKGHICGERFCKRCLGYHMKRWCYMRQFEERPKRDFRYIFMDTESMTHYRPNPSILKYLHETNFLWAYVTCSQCIDKGIWEKSPEKSCKICGINRLYAWAPFDFQGTEVDVFTKTDDPMGDFVDWAIRFEQNELKMQKGGNYLLDKAFGDCNYETDSSSEEEEKEEENKTKKKVQITFPNIIYAHAGSKYDNIFAFRRILQNEEIAPKLIRNGNRLYEMKVKGRDLTTTTFRDSYLLIPLKLAKFVETFNLNIESKSFFPYHFNREENYDITLDGLPDKKYYGPGSMSPDEKELLDKWYDENKEKIKFNLNDQIAEYCSNDVKILVHGMIKMRELFYQVTHQDLFLSITMPSACMHFFQSLLPKNHLALTPHMGYEKHGRQSTKARKFLKWLALLKNVKIHTADDPNGEIKYNVPYITQEGKIQYREYFLDGFIETDDNEKDIAIEVNGCYWHACPKCYPNDDELLAGGTPAGTIRERNAKRMEDLLMEFNVEVYWECEIDKMLAKEKIIRVQKDGQTKIINMRAFFENLPDTGPIDLKDAFFGGRTGPEAMVSSVIGRPNMKIRYRDFKSLYPFINWFTKYPIKHPELTIFDRDVDWWKPENLVDDAGNRIEGIIKCYVVPPRHVYEEIPVLPMRLKDSLIFPTCRLCAIKYKGSAKKRPTYQCPHFKDDERGFSTTITTLELEKALEAGYRVTHVYRFYNWPNPTDWDDKLFHPYMKVFMKLKYEAEGWPKECLQNDISEEEREKRKNEYIEKAWQLYGIRLDPSKIIKNPGMRYIAKLGLNSLWGRFALRNKLSISVIVNNQADLAYYLDNENLEIHVYDQLDDKNILICYRTKDEVLREHSASNLIVALWTTSAARVHLLNHLYKVVEGRNDSKIIYMDTDSIIYEFNDQIGDPLEKFSGDQLGALPQEYPSDEILEVISTAPKAYCIRMKDKNTEEEEEKYVRRMKGIPLSYDVKNKLSYERYKEMATNWGEVPEEEVTETFNLEKNFRSTRDGQINTVPMKKRLRPVINKGIVLSKEKIVHFGWSDRNWCRENNPFDCICKHNY